MKYKLISTFLIWTILLVGTSAGNVSAQTISKEPVDKGIQPNFQYSLQDELKNEFVSSLSLLSRSVLDTPIDFDKIEKDKLKKLPKRKMSGKRKAMWAAILIGSAIGMYFLIKYAKECEIYESNCLPDEICPCLKYKEKTNE